MSYFLTFLLVCTSICTTDYSKIFGADYQKALSYCKENKKAIADKAAQYNLPAAELEAVIFPELIRFSVFQNFFETKALELAYIAGGTGYADFSIGNFQMKPSFVEKLELAVAQDIVLKKEFEAIFNYPDKDITTQRKTRLERLQNFSWQMDYLCCFYKITTQKFEAKIKELNPETRLKFLATAYNAGFDKSVETIEKWMTRAAYPYGSKYPENQQHVYANVALDYFSRK
jgi:hypothetical protein